jgi:Zn-dependent protease with chaperone function
VDEAGARGLFYDGRTSRARPVRLTAARHGGVACVAVEGEGIALLMPASVMRNSMRVGSAHRFLALSDGQSIEVLDNDAFDRLLAVWGLPGAQRLVAGLERSGRAALLAVIALVAGTWAFLALGVPALTMRALAVIPPSVDERIGADSLAALDASTFRPSSLPAVRQAQLRALFAEVAAGAAPGSQAYRLELRRGGAIGANAIALPSGIVVLTDELEQQAHGDDELRGVLAHEVGHLVQRHALRMLIEQSMSALLMIGVLGDASSATSLTAAAPAALVNAGYSRDMERDADAFAYAWMRRHGIAPQRLTDLLQRLAARNAGREAGLLDTHPGLAERVRAAAKARRR